MSHTDRIKLVTFLAAIRGMTAQAYVDGKNVTITPEQAKRALDELFRNGSVAQNPAPG